MHLRTHARRAAVLVTSVASAALLAGIVPASPASAAVDDHDYLMLLDRSTGGRQVAAWETGQGDATKLTGRDTFATGFDVSVDGNTWIASLKTNGAGSAADSTYGVIFVHREGGTVTTRLIASYFDAAPPAIARDGKAAWFMAKGTIYKYVPSADWSTGTLTALSTAFAPAAGERPVAFAVSPNGQRGAMVYQSSGSSRIFAADFSYTAGTAATKAWFADATTSDTALHAIDPLTWLDDSTLLYGFYDTSTTPATTTSWTAAVQTGGGGAEAEQAAVEGRYAVRYNGASNWWTWKDLYTDTTLTGSSYAEVSDPLASVDELLDETFPLGTVTSNYVPTDSKPPVAPWANNRATANAQLFMSSTSVLYNKRAAYLAFASYLKPLPGQASSAAYANFQGELQYTYNPFVSSPKWNKVPTSGSGGLFTWGSAYPTPTFNGTTPYLKRNTWFRWLKPGDPLLKADMTNGTVKVTVKPLITVTKSALTSSGTRKVSGTVTRVGGTAVLQRYSSGTWSTVAQATITSDGTYSFGYRSLRSGTYRVSSLATQSWGSNTKTFAI